MTTKKEKYDLYKLYGLFKLAQEKSRLIDVLVEEIGNELKLTDDWFADIDVHYNQKDVSIEDVKKFCDKYYGKK